jgi:hypothetical protein
MPLEQLHIRREETRSQRHLDTGLILMHTTVHNNTPTRTHQHPSAKHLQHHKLKKLYTAGRPPSQYTTQHDPRNQNTMDIDRTQVPHTHTTAHNTPIVTKPNSYTPGRPPSPYQAQHDPRNKNMMDIDRSQMPPTHTTDHTPSLTKPNSDETYCMHYTRRPSTSRSMQHLCHHTHRSTTRSTRASKRDHRDPHTSDYFWLSKMVSHANRFETNNKSRKAQNRMYNTWRTESTTKT